MPKRKPENDERNEMDILKQQFIYPNPPIKHGMFKMTYCKKCYEKELETGETLEQILARK